MKKHLALAAALGLVLGVGLGVWLAQEPEVNWGDQEAKIAAAFNEVFVQQKAPEEVAQKVSACMAGKVVAHLSEKGCALKAPTDTLSALQVVDVCVGPVAALFFQECLADLK